MTHDNPHYWVNNDIAPNGKGSCDLYLADTYSFYSIEYKDTLG